MKKKVIVWGLGTVWRKLKRTIEEKYEIVGYGDSDKNLFMNGKPVWSTGQAAQIDDNSYDYILVTPYGVKREIICNLLRGGVKQDKIIPYYGENRLVTLGCAKYTETAIEVTIQNTVLKLRTFSDDAVFYEVFVSKRYDINSNDPYVVFDIGMNVGLTAIYYSMQQMCKKVYGFEPFPSTFQCAEENIRYCMDIRNKIDCRNIGLSNKCFSMDLYYDPQDSESMSIIRQNTGSYKEKVQIRDAGEELAPLLDQETGSVIICKIDCEGSEYEILESLERKELIEKIDVFLLEWHYVDDDRLTDCFERHNFMYMKNYAWSSMGELYAWKRGK